MEKQKDKIPQIDFSEQLCFDRSHELLENLMLGHLKSIAYDIERNDCDSIGVLIVLGDFGKFGPVINGMVQMKPKYNPVDSLIIVQDSDADLKEVIINFSKKPFDGAIVVDKSGQILGAGIYLVVDQPLIDIPDGCGTRHKAAASFSRRKDVASVLTLSEETNTVRVWKNGDPVLVFKPNKLGDRK